MKRDLESIFKRLKNIKQKLNKQMPEAYNHVIGPKETVKEEDDEYDVAIRERKAKEQQEALHSPINQSSEVTATDEAEAKLEQGKDALCETEVRDQTIRPEPDQI